MLMIDTSTTPPCISCVHGTAQFNLEIEEVECAQREIEHWRRDPSCPMTIEVCGQRGQS